MAELSSWAPRTTTAGARGCGPPPARRPVGPAPAAGPGPMRRSTATLRRLLRRRGRHDPGAGVAAAVGRRSSRRRWAIGLGVGTGLGASVAMARRCWWWCAGPTTATRAGGCARRRSRQLAGGRPGHVGGDVDRVRRRAAAGGRRGLPPVRQPTPGDRARHVRARAPGGGRGGLRGLPRHGAAAGDGGLGSRARLDRRARHPRAGPHQPVRRRRLPTPRGAGAVRPGAGPAAPGWERRASSVLGPPCWCSARCRRARSSG